MAKGTRFFRPQLIFTRSAARAHAGDSAAARAEQFRQIMLPHLDSAYNFARYLTRDANAAEDVVQDAFLRAFRSFASWRGDAPRAWLLAIVRNCFLDTVSGERGRYIAVGGADDVLSAVDSSDQSTPETIVAAQSEAIRLRETIEHLPEPFREALVLRELEELSYKEIALLTNVPIGTVMSRIARARQQLAELLLVDGEAGMRARS